jgi:hypothetical protein
MRDVAFNFAGAFEVADAAAEQSAAGDWLAWLK